MAQEISWAIKGGSSRSRNSRYKRRVREKLYLKSGGICGICGSRVEFNNSTLDHIIPLCKGGTWEQTNLQIAHLKCNEDKDDSILQRLVTF